jgi:hypothetical protein
MRRAGSSGVRFLVASCVVLSLSLATGVQSGVQPISMAASDWSLEGARTALVPYEGRNVLEVETGFGYRRAVRLMDGTIDFDVELTRRRSFVYVNFRMASDEEHEEFYLRPHKSSLPDALQYAPVWQGQSAWQLHHGPGGTAAVAFDAGVWTHVRVVMQGRHAALFVGDMTRPALLVARLSRDPRPGYIGFGGLAVPATGQPIARFSNIVVQPEVVGFDFASALAEQAASAATPDAQAPPPVVLAPGTSALVIREWAVSKAFPAETQPLVPGLPSENRLVPFQRLTSEADGLLELHQYVTLPESGRFTAAVARVRVQTDRAEVRALDLGFSDVATVFLNGRPIFTRDDSYSFDRPRRDGLIGYDQARVYLPLTQGVNQIDVVVSDRFGGWGLMGRFVDATGLHLLR